MSSWFPGQMMPVTSTNSPITQCDGTDLTLLSDEMRRGQRGMKSASQSSPMTSRMRIMNLDVNPYERAQAAHREAWALKENPS